MELSSRRGLPEERSDVPALEQVTVRTWGRVTAPVDMRALTLARIRYSGPACVVILPPRLRVSAR